MNTKLKTFVTMLWMFFIIYTLAVTAAVNFTIYYNENLFVDVLCLSSAAKLTGIFPLLSTCAVGCKKTDGCSSFFYSLTELECYSVDTVLTSRLGCDSRSDTSYYIRQADSDCYAYTQADQNQMISSSVPEKDQCESYQFHVYTAGSNQAYRGCGGCLCCQWKGCYDGSSRNYNGTWSQTKYGRRCQRWDSQSPHGHINNAPSLFPQDASVFDAHNYCRDPDYGGGPWCYTEDPSVRWEFCDITKC